MTVQLPFYVEIIIYSERLSPPPFCKRPPLHWFTLGMAKKLANHFIAVDTSRNIFGAMWKLKE
jgi:hypothetical protein